MPLFQGGEGGFAETEEPETGRQGCVSSAVRSARVEGDTRAQRPSRMLGGQG